MSSRWLENLPETHRACTDKTDKPALVSNVSRRPAHIQKKAEVTLGEMYEAVHYRIAARYLDGTHKWLREYQPELLARIDQLGDKWGTIWYRHQYENGPADVSAFNAALAEWEAAWGKAQALYATSNSDFSPNDFGK